MLGLIFLRYADERFAQAGETVGSESERRRIGEEDYAERTPSFETPWEC